MGQRLGFFLKAALVITFCLSVGMLTVLFGELFFRWKQPPIQPQRQRVEQVIPYEPSEQEQAQAQGEPLEEYKTVEEIMNFYDEEGNPRKMTEDEWIEYSNMKAEHNPAVAHTLREGEAESFPCENIEGIDTLDSLPTENAERSLLYIGYFLTKQGYDVHATRIVIFDRVDIWSFNSDVKIFYFQVKGEGAYYRVFVEDIEGYPVNINELTERIEGVNDDQYQLSLTMQDGQLRVYYRRLTDSPDLPQ
ncbi:MAG: hypothetical protein LBS98_07240 [Coriobacteriales bacterium]|jgi:hypothetical protein|nr:hypothetical protein [Coriobacteriales bacterium]